MTVEFDIIVIIVWQPSKQIFHGRDKNAKDQSLGTSYITLFYTIPALL